MRKKLSQKVPYKRRYGEEEHLPITIHWFAYSRILIAQAIPLIMATGQKYQFKNKCLGLTGWMSHKMKGDNSSRKKLLLSDY